MRKMVLGSVTAAFLLSGCATLNPQTVAFINSVELWTAQACKFIPEASSILAVFNAGIGTTVAAVASAICAAVPPPASALHRALPRYGAAGPPAAAGTLGGVVINGWRT